mgnify:CR=1 FL=1
MTEQNRKGNGGLYFIVGALVLAVAVMGYFYMDDTDTMGNIEPAAGVERPVNSPYTAGGANTTTMDNEVGSDLNDGTTRQYNNDMD